MLEWLTNELMKLEAENKVGAHKGEHCPTQTTILSEPESDDLIPGWEPSPFWFGKLRKGGSIPFFVTKKETLGASPPKRWFKKPSSMVFPPEKWNVLLKT
jgi:hypothetical protein